MIVRYHRDISADALCSLICCFQVTFSEYLMKDLLSTHKDPLQDEGASVGGLFLISCPQSQEAGARGGGNAALSQCC